MAQSREHTMGTEDASQSWYWADSDGVQSIVDEWELSSSLSTGTLPPYTLVWREGWKEWIPACRIAELATLLPKDSVEPAVQPELDPTLTDPPPPPVDKYQAYRAREAAAKLLGRVGRATLPTPMPPPAGAVVPGGGVVPPPPAPRAAQPTLIDGTALSATATLRPPGAVPPPPRAVPQAVQAAVPPPPPPAAPIPPAPASPVIRMGNVGSDADAAPASTEYPTAPRAAPPPDAPLPSWSEDVDAELSREPAGLAAQPMLAPTAAVPQPGSSRSMLFLLLGVMAFAVLGVVGVAVVVVVMRSSGKQQGTPAPSASAAVPSPTPRAALLPCRVLRSAARLAPSASVSNTPVIAAIGSKLAVGYAASAREAEGLTVDPETLAVERPFHQATPQSISSVIPITSGGGLGFFVDLESDALKSPRTLDVRPRVTLGWTEAGFARAVAGAAPSVLWPGASEKVSDTRVVPLAGGRGFAVTVRRGGKSSGTILVGRLGPEGERTTDPVEIGTNTQVGTPAVAVNDQSTLVAFATRPSSDAYWTLALAAGRGDRLPERPESFATPPGGLGADAISPAVEGLPNGRWLLQWTEGSSGKRQVRLQTLGPDLVPVGDPLTLSSEDANAGQGVVMVRDGKGVSLFLVSKGRSHELWGATLSCP